MDTRSPIDLLQRLVAIPSLNPEDSRDPELVGEARVAAFLEELLTGLGFTTEQLEVFPGRPNLIARAGSGDPASSLMIEGHMDTVSIDGMIIPPFDPEIRDGKLYGRGSSDAKGPMAAALAAIARNADALQASSKPFIFAAAVAEEKGTVGAVQMAEAGIGAGQLIALEPTSCLPVIGHKGANWFKVTVRGRSAHAADPARGVNAIDGMTDAIRALHEAHAVRVGRHTHPLLGSPTLSVGTIQAGKGVNIVPDECVVHVDSRLVPGEDPDAFLADLQARLDALATEGCFVSALAETTARRNPFLTDPASPLVQGLLDCGRAHGVEGEPFGTSWFSDAGPLAPNCGETVVFGPGSIEQAHIVDEFIEVAELERGADVLSDYIARWLNT